MSEPSTPTRINDGFVSGRERKILLWLAARAPASFTPDVMTMIGIAGAGLTFAGFCASSLDLNWLWLAVAGLCVHWYGDSMDGTIARHRGIERPRYGYFLDQNTDVIGNLLIMGGIGFSPLVRMDVALLVVAAYHMISIYALVKAIVIREFNVTIMNLGPTEARILLAFFALCGWWFGPVPLIASPVELTLWDGAMLLSALAIMGMFALSFRKTAQQLLREETRDE